MTTKSVRKSGKVKGKKTGKKCSICRKVGHNQRTCPKA